MIIYDLLHKTIFFKKNEFDRLYPASKFAKDFKDDHD